MNSSLCNYCTENQIQDFLLSLHLTGTLTHSPKAELALLYGLANHAEEHYERVLLPKKDGSKRILHVPDSVLKHVQKQILRQVLMEIPVSSYSCAYQKGSSLSQNAAPHKGQKLLLKLDIHDFFGSISYISVYQHGFPLRTDPDPVSTHCWHICAVIRICFLRAHLLPLYLSNLVMKPFDEYMGNWCREREIAYTRYCDDLTFSGDFNPKEVYRKAKGFLNRLGFEVNSRKTHIISQKNRQEVTRSVNEKHGSEKLPPTTSTGMLLYSKVWSGKSFKTDRLSGQLC